MIVLFKKGEVYKAGDSFPLISIPIETEGESREFNDFQWWAPTDKWNEWIKAHPRDWQAESEIQEENFRKKLYENLVTEGEINPAVLDFNSFNLILEEESQNTDSVGITSSEPATEEQKKNYTKFVFAYNKLKEAGTIKNEIQISSLSKGEEYAIVCDLPGNDGSPVVETRQAYRTKIVSDLPNSLLAKIDESIPFGKFEEGVSMGDQIIKIAKDGGRIIAGGVVAVGIVAGGIWATKSYLKRAATRAALNGGKSWFSRIFSSGVEKSVASNAAKSVVNPATASELELATGVSAEALGTAGSTEVIVSSTAPVAAETGFGAFLASNPVGWITAAVILATETIQRIVNFTSDDQAPRLGQIEDEGWAKDKFMPGTIPDGEAITVCWTQSAGNGWFTDVLWNEDTRTTMDLIKIGNFKGKSIFLLVQINSKEYDAILKSKEMVLLAFDQNAKFDRTWYDNDDLEFEMITIEKGDTKNVISTVFDGYCSWEEMQSAYNGADDSFIGVPENAPEEYSFHYKSGKGDRDVNVTGTLIKDISSLDVMKSSFASGETSSNESNTYQIDWKNIPNSDILSFSDFSKIPLTVVRTFEADETADTEPQVDPEKENKYLTQTEKIAAYEVTNIEFADKSLEDQDLPELRTFIVPNNYLEATDDEKIVVQPVQNVTLKYPRRGTIIIESEEAPEPIPVGIEGATGENEPDIEGGVPVEVTPDEIKIKYRDDPDALNSIGIPDVTKIKDKDKDDNIKILDMITPEEKKDLDMEDWDYIKKVKIYKDGKSGEPIMIKFKSGGITGDRKRKIKADDENFDTALKVANRIQAGFHGAEDKDEDEY